MKSFLRLALCAAALLLAVFSKADNIIPNQLISADTTWYKTNTYTLNGSVFVRNGATLTIEAGTVIKGHNLGAFGTNVAALFICRGARINAEGTAQNPIIFTADVDNLAFVEDLDMLQRGLWGGVVIFGRTTINGALDVTGRASTPMYEVYEGMPDLVVNAAGQIQIGGEGEALFRFGGNDDNDNSGVLRYVSIRHGGAKLSTDKEINGLSLGAVGRGTLIEYVESYAIADDGFEFFGGTVNTKHLVSAFCDDDTFDVDMGYRGTNQFWFGIQSPDARNYGMELNSQINEIQTSNLLSPQALFRVYNMTLIGSGVTNRLTTGGRNAAMVLRPYVGPKIYNSIFTDFNERAIEIETRNGVESSVSVTNGYAEFRNNLWWGFVTGSGSGTVNNSITNLARLSVATNYWTDASLTNQIADPMLRSIARTNFQASVDPRPLPGSPALSDYAPTPAGFLTEVNYRGAFSPTNLWIANWTALSAYGVLTPAGTTTNNVPQLISQDTTWYRTNVYMLNGSVFVRNGATLTIEPGTIIKGRNLGAFGTNVAALFICRGAKIKAEGAPQNPIIFTADVDDLAFDEDLDMLQRGLWGGVVIFGRTTINGALDVTGRAATPMYEVYEGMPDLVVNAAGQIQIGGEGEALFRFGGNDDNDNSGVMRYVSIRHGGAKLSTDKEINGLSLGAVGRGTTVEFVESYAIADDGFEFFGGAVNTKYLVSAFCDDDTFDVDMGYRGTNQFWFGIQAPDARNYGMELNSQINEIQTSNLLSPQALFRVYNMTLIGSGVTNRLTTGGRNGALVLRPYVGPKIYNSIFTDFNERAIEIETRNGVESSVSVTNGYAEFRNNLWWGFVTGSGSGVINNSITNLSRLSVASLYWTDLTLTNQIVDPLLNSISRTNFGPMLDPRPAAGSPAFTDAAASASGLVQANYRGAFGPGRSNWAADWTTLATYGILTGFGGVNPAPAAASAIALQPELLSVRAGADVNLTFNTQVGFNYQLLSSTNLSGTVSWNPEGSVIAGTGSSVTVPVAAAGSQKFLRVSVQ